MNLQNIFFYYPLFLFASIAQSMEQAAITAMEADSEYVVLFRGNHFGMDTADAQIAAINYDQQEAVDSRYVSLSQDGYTLEQRRRLALKRLASMRESGPYTPKVSTKSLPYPSAYHWVLEQYVNHYAQFKKQLKETTSELSQLLKKYALSFDDIFFVSTSLNLRTAVKYASGLCSGAYKKWPDWSRDDINKSMIVGFIDVFVIPRKDLDELGAFPVVEEFASHTMELSYKVLQKNYTVAEEYVFPLSIPQRYHKKRVPITIRKEAIIKKRKPSSKKAKTVAKNDKPKKDNFFKRFMNKQVATIVGDLNAPLEELVKTVQGRRVFLYLLQNRLENGNDKLEPAEAVLLNEKVAPLIIKTYQEIKQSGKSSQEMLNLPSSIAIERAITSLKSSEFSLQCNDFEQNPLRQIAALIRHQNLTHVTIGTKKDLESVGDECLGMGTFRYEDPVAIDDVLLAAKERIAAIRFVIAFIISPELMRLLQDLERRSQGKLRFDIDRQNYDAQQFECFEAEALAGESDHVRKALFPTCYEVEQIVEKFVKRLEVLVDTFSNALYDCEGFNYSDIGCHLDLDELRLEDSDLPGTHIPSEAMAFLEKYQKQADQFLTSDYDKLFDAADEYLHDKYDDSEQVPGIAESHTDSSSESYEEESLTERYMDAFEACYNKASKKFQRKLSALIDKTASALEELVEYDSGDAESSSDDKESSSSTLAHKRGPIRTTDSLQTDYIGRGFILKKRAVSKE